MKTYALIAGGLLLFGLLVFGLEKLASQDEDLRTVTTQATAADTKIQGKAEAPVTLIEYSDFQCPACAAYAPLVKNLGQDFPDTLKIVYRYFPLTSIHKNATISAKAAEAAHRQGKFWEMQELLFQHQNDWAKSENPTDSFQSYAQAIGLNIDQFNADMQDASIIDPIKSDEAMGSEANIPGTPSFFLNGKKIENPEDYEAFKKLIEDEIAKTSPAQGTENK
ncbi:MAG: thioredoxin domain-containing protein [Candidatus Moranbacteria bacterium]|nr:thioredoxin domain-containing protein [Candidatus Moranbacteria bacterium]